MNVILAWLSQQAPLVYLACLLGALGYVVAAVSAKRRRDAAQFSLEREVYQQHMSRAWLMSALFLALGGIVFLVSTFIAPPPPRQAATTPTPSIGLFTPTPTVIQPAADALTVTSTITPVVIAPSDPTPTLMPTNTPTPVPPEAAQPDCPDPNAQITSPTAGSNLSGIVEIEGTANTNAFSFYKFEVQFPGSNTPNFISQYDAAVINGPLGTWDVSDPARYPPGGPYRFQLVVVDIYGNTTTCTIPVNIAPTEE